MYKLKCTMFLVLLTILFCPGNMALAQDNEKDVDEVGKITVTGERKDVVGYEKSVIPEEDVRQPTIGGSVVDVLQDQAGIQLLRTSVITPENNKLRLRGFDETRFRVELDGMPLKRDGSYGGTGAIHWSTLSTENVSYIEIQRGAVSAKYGNTLGGVISIGTSKPSDKPKTSVEMVYGSLATWNADVHHSAKAGPFWWTLSGSHFETDGYLRNNYTDRNNVSINLGVELPWDLEIGGGMDYSEMETGMTVYNFPDSPYYDNNDPMGDSSTLGGPGTRMINGDLTWGEESNADDKNVAFKAFINREVVFSTRPSTRRKPNSTSWVSSNRFLSQI